VPRLTGRLPSTNTGAVCRKASLPLTMVNAQNDMTDGSEQGLNWLLFEC
jgi:hypothetical protein